MSEISDMIQRLCPDGVEYRKLGKVCLRQKGIAITAQQMKDLHKEGAPIRIFAGGSTYADVDYTDVPSYIDKESVVVKSRGNIGFEYRDKPFTHKNEMWSYSKKSEGLINMKYVFYYLQNNAVYFQKLAKTGKLPQIATPDTDNFEIPVPPLEVQRKIVEVLDNFSELTAKLTAELEARKKQYEYYRDNLLNFSQIAPNSVKWMKLGEVCSIKGRIGFRGYTRRDIIRNNDGAISLSPSNIVDNNLRFEDCTFIRWDKYYESPEIIANVNDIVFTKTASVGKLAIIESLPQKATINPQLVLLKEITCSPKYLFYYMTTEKFQSDVRVITGVGSVPNVPQSSLSKLLIPIPPLSEQERIVSILDRFEALTTDLTSGLPAEIKARQQQYEYYRDKLLSFPRKASNS